MQRDGGDLIDYDHLRVLLMSGHMLSLVNHVNMQRWTNFFRPKINPETFTKKYRILGLIVVPKQRVTLLTRASIVYILVRRLMSSRCAYRIRTPFHHSSCIARRWLAPITLNPRNLENLMYLQKAIFQKGVNFYNRKHYFLASICFRDAWMLHHLKSNVCLADMYITGRVEWGKIPNFLRKNSKEAFDLAFCGALTKCMDSVGILAYCYLSGEGTERSPERGLAHALRSSKAGSCYGQFALGLCYKQGLCIFIDFSEAVRLFHLAAAQDHTLAQYNLGIMYENGLGVSKDIRTALEWYNKASNQGLYVAWEKTMSLSNKL